MKNRTQQSIKSEMRRHAVAIMDLTEEMKVEAGLSEAVKALRMIASQTVTTDRTAKRMRGIAASTLKRIGVD